MIGMIKGHVEMRGLDHCIVDVNGVGYRIYISGTTGEKFGVGDTVKLLTYLHVREDALLLYGFYTQEEYDLFTLLISVSGIGPKGAMGILGAIQPGSFRTAVSQKNLAVLQKLPGVGKKTAERLLLELQDKIGVIAVTDDGMSDVAPVSTTVPQGPEGEVLSALVSLGYSAQEVLPVIAQEKERHETVESLLRSVLRALGTGR